MADDDANQQDEGDLEAGEVEVGEGKKGSKRLIFLVVLPLLLVIGAAAGAYFTGAADPLIALIFGRGDEVAEKPPSDEKIERQKKARTGTFYELPEVLVNLNASGRKAQYLKMRVTLELDNPDDASKLESSLPRIMDNFQVYLRELRVEDLHGSAGVYRLREELLARVNAATAPTKINDVLFREMLIQ
ncbi:MAG: flagellar basal body-associated FliL family protein [Proteobacteria bacterium]|nr:flagellar basal body-associated FliL family protein [Pseudomonadota bacterium]